MINTKKTNILVFSICTIIISTLYFIVNKLDKENIINFFSLYGVFVSMFGVWLTYQQILSVKEISFKTQKELDNSLQQINQFFSISDISTTIKIIHEVQSYIMHKKYELALVRMRDLKSILIQIKCNGKIEDCIDANLFTSLIPKLGVDIVNINDLLLKTKNGVDFSIISRNLETIETSLEEIVSKLKYKML